jgi:DNA-binding NarL/FixJ family response regulator
VTVRVLIADDAESFRSAAESVVDATPGFELVGAAESGEQAVELARTLAPDLVLVDWRMPGTGGGEAARQIARDRAEATVVLLSVNPAGTDPGPFRVLDKRDFSPRALQALWSG